MKNEQMPDEQATRQMLEHEADGLERWKNLAKVTRFEYFLIFPYHPPRRLRRSSSSFIVTKENIASTYFDTISCSMTFTHPMYLQQQQQHQHQQQGAPQSLGRNQSGSEPSMNTSQGLSGNNQFLPASAPVSSLLPPIPTQNDVHTHTSTSLQAKLAALLSNSGYANHNNGQYGGQQQQNQNPYANQRGESADSHQGAYSSNGGGFNAGMSNMMLPGMQNWNAERLGTSYLRVIETLHPS
jgi:hypothetical protein